MQTLGSVLDKKAGIGYGFDFLRVFLASAVVLVHSYGGALKQEYPHVLFAHSLVPLFFALSGFLVASSAVRLRLKYFVLNRVLRIMPALMIAVIIAACVVGPIFTTLPLAEYYGSAGFFSYFLNILGLAHYYLPGVFEANPYATVNINLWSIPYEMCCYVIITGMVYARLLHRRQLMLLFVSVVAVAVAASFKSESLLSEWLGLSSDKAHLVDSVAFNFFTRGRIVYVYFLTGSIFYLYREKIPYSLPLFFIAAALLVYQSFLTPNFTQLQLLFYAPALVYVMAFIGVSDIPRVPLFHRGDYSYGIYLYGSLIQQAIMAIALPQGLSAFALFGIAYPLTVLVAIASWHWVERPVLSMRKNSSLLRKDALSIAARLK